MKDENLNIKPVARHEGDIHEMDVNRCWHPFIDAIRIHWTRLTHSTITFFISIALVFRVYISFTFKPNLIRCATKGKKTIRHVNKLIKGDRHIYSCLLVHYESERYEYIGIAVLLPFTIAAAIITIIPWIVIMKRSILLSFLFISVRGGGSLGLFLFSLFIQHYLYEIIRSSNNQWTSV